MERTFWIQGRTGRYWQNLESLDDDQTAIVRLGTLIGENRYDELRLVQAQISTISGETTYTNIVTVQDGQVIDSPMLRAQAAAQAKGPDLSAQMAPDPGSNPAANPAANPGDAADPETATDPASGQGGLEGADGEDGLDPESHPQLRFWPTPKPENLQGRLGLGGETRWVEEPDATDASTDQQGPYGQHRDDRHDSPRAPHAGPPEPIADKPVRKTAKFVPHVTVEHSRIDPVVPAPNPPAASESPVERAASPADGHPAADAHGGAGSDPTRAASPAKAGARRDQDGARKPKRPHAHTGGRRARNGLAADPQVRAGGPARRYPGWLSRLGGGDGTGRGHRDGPGRTALMSGVFAGALAAGLALSAINPDFAGRFFAGVSGQMGAFLPQTGLVAAIEAGDLQTVRARLAEGVDPNTLDAEGNPALLRAARSGNLAAVSLLLQAGADPTLPTQDGRSVLHRIAAEGRSQALQRMLDAGAPIDLAGGVYGCLTPLSVASANGRVRAASLLAENGASFESQNGCTVGPMEIAAAHPHVLARLEQIRAERDALLAMSAVEDSPASAPTNARTSAGAQPGSGPITARMEPPPAAVPADPEAPPALEPSLEGDLPPGTAEDLAAAAPDPAGESAGRAPSEADTGQTAAGQTETVFRPPEKPEAPAKPVQTAAATDQAAAPAPHDPRVFSTKLKSAIDSGDTGTVVALLGSPPPGFSLDEARYAVEDPFGSGVRTALEQAALRGEAEIVRLLSDEGASIPPGLVHRVVQNADDTNLAGMLSVLLEEGADPNAMADGLTPLMRAALRGDPQTAYMLMAFGADPAAVSTDGRQAADFAREAGRQDMEERLVLAATEPYYRNLMMGLSWSDTLATLRNKVEVCKDIGDDFTACKLSIDSWLDDAKVIVAQFDRKASDRLVAIQVDSRPFNSVAEARGRFDAVRRAVQSRMPQGHAGFTTTEVASNETLFRDLQPAVNRGRYFSYWPDQDKRRPVFVHLKLTGLSEDQGFYRIVIGNPFRAS